MQRLWVGAIAMQKVSPEMLQRARAKAGAVIAIDVRSGEILALANVPSYNPNNRARLTGAQLRNRVITDLFDAPRQQVSPCPAACLIDPPPPLG